MNSTLAHKAYEAMLAHERSWAGAARAARSSHEYDVAMNWRWHYMDAAGRAAQLHDPVDCSICQTESVCASITS